MVFGNPNEWAGGGSVGLRCFSWRRANLLRFAPASSPHPYLLPVSAKPLTAAAPAGDAMTPEVLVQGVIARIQALGAASVRKMDGLEETIKFPLPKGLKLEPLSISKSKK